MKNEGFLFLEAALLGLLLVVMAGLCALPRRAAELERMQACRTTAVFLAEQELTELELRARQGTPPTAPCGWLGPADDLADRQTAYEVTGTAQKDGMRGYALTAHVAWQEGGAEKSLRLERWVAQHDLP